MSDVDIPGMGKVSRKQAYIFIGIAVAVAGFGYYRYTHSTSARVDTSTVDPSTIDPATGYAYGSAEDAQALADQQAYVTPVTAGSYGDGTTGSDSTGDTSTNAAVTTADANAQWVNTAVEYVASNTSYPVHTISSILSAYAAGRSVIGGGVEDGIIREALAGVGAPPTPGHDGYPPAIRLTSAPATGTNPPPKSTPTPAPTPAPRETNAQWASAAIAHLERTSSLPAHTISSIINAYANGGTIQGGGAESDLIHQAIAAEGLPPVSGANGYPPSIHTV